MVDGLHGCFTVDVTWYVCVLVLSMGLQTLFWVDLQTQIGHGTVAGLNLPGRQHQWEDAEQDCFYRLLYRTRHEFGALFKWRQACTGI